MSLTSRASRSSTRRCPNCPRVKESPVHFDCRYHSTKRLPGDPPMGTVNLIIAEVVRVHIKDEVLTDGILDVREILIPFLLFV
jgi:flavin reductase (DIM6/NTAB) family NADH-FMN oxidoreductase RutF